MRGSWLSPQHRRGPAWRKSLPGFRAALVSLLATCLCVDARDVLPDFSSLSLQELANVKVTSVSNKQQKLSQVAAAVYVISQEEIHRSGMTNVADVLRLAPGLSVARIDASKWGVTSRGYNGRFANKLLVLVDGRSVYSPIFSGVYWDMNMPLLDNIDRIEVIRGPGAAIWGANAVSGVVNIITKSAKETTGVEVTTSAGSQDRGSVQVQAGGKMWGGSSYRTYVRAADHAALQTADGNSARDGWSELQTGFRVDGSSRNGGWQLEGDLFQNSRGESSDLPLPQNQFVGQTRYSTNSGYSGDLAFEWRRRISDTSELRINSSYDHMERPEMELRTMEDSTGSLDLQYHFTAGQHHDISLGLGDRFIAENIVGNGLSSFSPPRLNYQTTSAFAQDEIHLLSDRVLVTAGVKVQHDVLSGWQTQPTGRILWAPNKKHSAWVSASRAVRTPTFYERNADVELGAIPASPATFGVPVIYAVNGSATFQSEVSKDYELGYRAQLSPQLSVDVASFFTRYDNLRTVSPEDPSLMGGAQPYLLQPFLFTNLNDGGAAGGELAVTYHPLSHLKLAASYSYLAVHQDLEAVTGVGMQPSEINEAPSQQVKVQSYWNLSKSVQLDTHLFYSTSFQALYMTSTANIPAHFRADVRLSWRIQPRWEVSIVGQDLGAGRLLELTPEVFSSASYTGRSFNVKSTFRF